MKIRHVLMFMGAVFFFLFITQIGTRAYWSQEKGRLVWHDGQVLSEEDEILYTYIIRPKPTATPAVIAPTSPLLETPTAILTPADYTISPTLEPTPVYDECLPAGTKVRMADLTEKNIEDVKVGDYVLSYDGKKQVHSKVLETSMPVRNDIYTLHFEDGQALRLTEEHPVYTGGGWKSINPSAAKFLKTSPLSEGDSVFTFDGSYKSVDRITHEEKKTQLYNLKNIENTNVFYANDVLVHNKIAGLLAIAAGDVGIDYSAGSFPAGTKVLMEGGTLKSIELVQPGNRVITRDSGVFGTAAVLEVKTQARYNSCMITLEDKILTLMPETPVYTAAGWKAIDKDTASSLTGLPITDLIANSDSVYYSSNGTRGRWVPVSNFECVPSDTVITYNLTRLDNGFTFFADNFLVHNKAATTTSSSSSSSAASYSSSSSSSSSLVPCGTEYCTATQTCYNNHCWLKCGLNGYCAGLYVCFADACLPIVGGSSSSYTYAPTVTPYPTTLLSSSQGSVSSFSSYSSQPLATPIIPVRPTNTPYPTRVPRNMTYFESTDSDIPVIRMPSPTPIPDILRGKTSTIVIENEKSTTILKGEDVAEIKIAAPGSAKSGKGLTGTDPLQAKNNQQGDPEESGSTMLPLLDLSLALKQEGIANFGIQQEEIIVQKGKQVVTISAQHDNIGLLSITQNNTTALTSMSMSINPSTNILTIETPYGPKRVSIMPDEALAIIRQLKITDYGRTPDEVRILVRNNQLEYKITASRLQKLFWLFPIVIPQEVYVSADSGGLMAVQKSPLYSFISLFAF